MFSMKIFRATGTFSRGVENALRVIPSYFSTIPETSGQLISQDLRVPKEPNLVGQQFQELVHKSRGVRYLVRTIIIKTTELMSIFYFSNRSIDWVLLILEIY